MLRISRTGAMCKGEERGKVEFEWKREGGTVRA